MSMAYRFTLILLLVACEPQAQSSTHQASENAHNLLPAPDLLPVPASGSEMASAPVFVPTLAQAASAAAASQAAASEPQFASMEELIAAKIGVVSAPVSGASAASGAASAVAPNMAPAPKVAPLAPKTASAASSAAPSFAPNASVQPRPLQSRKFNADALIHEAEQRATGRTKNILKTAREMTLMQQEIVRGSCWDYLNTAWNRAGVPAQARKVVYADKINGNYADPSQLQAGDWIYHVNHSYHNIEHSGMFIGWVDKNKKQGLTLSYAGENRHEPARYRVYDLSSVYQITRAAP